MQKFTIGKHTFEVPELREADALKSSGPKNATAAVEALQSALAEINAIERDTRLSALGQAEKAAPLRAGIVRGIAQMAALAREDALEAERRDAALTAVPPVPPTAGAVAAEDAEARAWWRTLPVEERARIMQELTDNPEAAKKYERLQLAVLRSPVPLPDMEAQHMGNLWAQTQRLDNPAEALAINSLHRAADWSSLVLGHVGGIAGRTVGLSRAEILDVLTAAGGLALEGAHAFGFSAGDIAQAQRVAEARTAAQGAAKA